MKYAKDKIAESVENPKAKNKLKHIATKSRNLSRQKASYKTDNSGEKTGQKRTPLKRKPIFKQLVKTKRKKIGKESNYDNGKVTKNRLQKSKPSH